MPSAIAFRANLVAIGHVVPNAVLRLDERPLANEFQFRRVLGGSRVLQRTMQIHAIARSEPLSALQCQRRADVSRGRDLFRPGIGETPIFAESSIRGMRDMEWRLPPLRG